MPANSQDNHADDQADKSETDEPGADLPETVTRDDLAAKLTELRDSMPYLGEDGPSVSANTMKALTAGLGIAAAYFYGWRKGKKRNKTVIEVRRVK